MRLGDVDDVKAIETAFSMGVEAGRNIEREAIAIYIRTISESLDALGPPALHDVLTMLAKAIEDGEHSK